MKRLFNDCSYVCGLNSKLFLHTDKNIMICILTLYLLIFALNIDLGMSMLSSYFYIRWWFVRIQI